jgi:hypothetical protein
MIGDRQSSPYMMFTILGSGLTIFMKIFNDLEEYIRW